MPKREFTVSGGRGAGIRLDVYLSGEMDHAARSRIHQFIEKGMVAVNARPKKPGYKLREGDRIEVDGDLEEDGRAAGTLQPENLPLNILYSDGAVVVIDKPAGLVVHPGAGNRSGTLTNALLHRFPEIAGVGAADRPGIVHRLDKETSGVMVAALRPEAYASLQKQFKDRVIGKVYLGLVWGRMKTKEGRIDWPIGRHFRDGQRISIHTRKPRPAETLFRVIEEMGEMSLLEIRPLTGRTHQIRVHLAAAGHPIAGDSRYGRRREKPKFPRLFLHAHRLAFVHPETGERREFISPLPEDLLGILERARRIRA